MSGEIGLTLWLLGHELSLYWRSIPGKWGAGVSIFLLVLVCHFLGFLTIGIAEAAYDLNDRAVLLATSLAMGFCFLALISAGLADIMQVFQFRQDLDLLVAAPIPVRPVMVARLVTIAVMVVSQSAMFLLPMANILALMVDPGWWRAYLILPLLSLLAVSVSFGLYLLLFRRFGARQARVFVQVIAALVGIPLIVAPQVANLSTAEQATFILDRLNAIADRVGDVPGLYWPAEAALGDPVKLALFISLCLAVFGATIGRYSKAFLDLSMTDPAGDPHPTVQEPSPHRDRTVRIAANPAVALRRKEWLVLRRDPGLLLEIMQSMVYLVPLAFALGRFNGNSQKFAWVVLVVMSAQMASVLSWILLGSEDAPEFLAAAPIDTDLPIRSKVTAAIMMVACFVGPILLIPLILYPPVGLVIGACCLGAAGVSAVLPLNFGTIRQRNKFNRRPPKAGFGVTLLNMLVTVVSALTASLLLFFLTE